MNGTDTATERVENLAPGEARVLPVERPKWPRWRAYWAALRPQESMMMLGVPLLGVLFGAKRLTIADLSPVVLLLAGAALVAGHVYTLNDLLGLETDVHDRSKAERPLLSGALRVREAVLFSVLLLVGGLVVLSLLSLRVTVVAVLICLLWTAYAAPGLCLKGIAVVTSLVNGLGAGVLPFILGFVLFAPAERLGEGLILGLYFGLIAGAGQMNREIMDMEVDVRTGFRTTAVWLGRRLTFVLSFLLFGLATVLLVAIAVAGMVPLSLAALAAAGVPVHGWIFVRCWRRGVHRSSVAQYVEDYRNLYLVLGLLMTGVIILRAWW